MPALSKITIEQKKLTRRYLVWCYKTTKEDLDRVDRYFTQLLADAVILQELEKGSAQDNSSNAYWQKVEDFKKYMTQKESNVFSKKFSDPRKKILNPDYLYLQKRLAGIEKAIVYFLGKKELGVIEQLYEEEMTRRILEAREHT